MQKEIVLASTNFTLVYKLKNAVSDEFDFIHVRPDDDYLRKFKIIFSSISETVYIDHHNVIGLDPLNSMFQIKSQIIKAINKNPEDNECYIGIDPGNSIGVCIILNQILVDSTVFYSKSKMIQWIKSKLREINKAITIIRVGDGGGKNQAEIIEMLQKNITANIELQLVNEKNTSKKITSHITSHEQAAIRIAKRKGQII
ncbi:MAG: hypothetical protein ACW99A_02680 [Candidatus Kariarchaeaceae archaeon]